ncbi:LacI family DNA-binding transcriptional regulator [Nocardioides sp.]|uniref:LacI family DNA-binding transcriptional regulator n=1 Tax=Nocardioides sp. TaxID=35761 RepID=UPI0025CCC91A|nr:LacI family DNA-binding transcriptional regulator [Nocardioides sp.]
MADTPGSKRATLARVAELAGVSVMTASYTYNRPERVSEQARAKVLAAAEELGYAGPHPSARSLRRGSTLALGVVLGEHLTYAFDDPAAVAFMAGIAEVCAERGFGMTILPITGEPEDAERIADAAVDGFVVWTTADDDPTLAAVLATRRPAVIHNGSRVRGLVQVSIDNRAAARAVGDVAFAGASRPAVISHPLSRERVASITRGAELGELGDVGFPVTRDRLAGYREAAEEAGTPWSDVVVAVCARNDPAEAERAATALLTSPGPPDAIAAMSDQMALGVLRAADTLGLAVPGDLAVTGWDDLPAAAGAGLTTVHQSMREQGATCARAALGRRPRSSTAPWSLVTRSSTR